MELQRPRVRLRDLSPSDVPLLERWWGEPEASYLDGGDRSGPAGDFKKKLISKLARGEEKNWFIVELDEREPIGYVLHRGTAEPPECVEVAMRLSESYWGRGLGTRALELLLERLFGMPSVKLVWLTVYVFNQRGIRLYEKLGFKIDENFMDDRRLELFRMSLARADWLEKKKELNRVD